MTSPLYRKTSSCPQEGDSQSPTVWGARPAGGGGQEGLAGSHPPLAAGQASLPGVARTRAPGPTVTVPGWKAPPPACPPRGPAAPLPLQPPLHLLWESCTKDARPCPFPRELALGTPSAAQVSLGPTTHQTPTPLPTPMPTPMHTPLPHTHIPACTPPPHIPLHTPTPTHTPT